MRTLFLQQEKIRSQQLQHNDTGKENDMIEIIGTFNTAKLMDENQTLYKLKELEYVERICENVGNISLNGNGNILTQLTSILNGNNV